MRRVRKQNQVRERLLFDPDPCAMQLEEQVVARPRGIVDRDQASDPSALVGVDRAARGASEPTVGSDVHLPRLDRAVDSVRETAQDQDPGPVEIAGVANRHSNAGTHLEQGHHGPAKIQHLEPGYHR